jgi:hypothetical protein
LAQQLLLAHFKKYEKKYTGSAAALAAFSVVALALPFIAFAAGPAAINGLSSYACWWHFKKMLAAQGLYN